MDDHDQRSGAHATSCPFFALEFAQVPANLDMETLKIKYRAASLRHHPDKAPPGLSEAERAQKTARMQQINDAFNVLKARLADSTDPLSGVCAFSGGGLIERW
jgi:hypothetical protein